VAQDKKIATDLADRALSKRQVIALAHVAKGDTLRFWQTEQALLEYNAALEINPNFPVAYAGKGQVLVVSGRARAKPSLRSNWLFALVPKILLSSFGISTSAIRTFIYMNTRKQSRNADGRSI
jgi:tetratricopeptide (TPR) repeat protein